MQRQGRRWATRVAQRLGAVQPKSSSPPLSLLSAGPPSAPATTVCQFSSLYGSRGPTRCSTPSHRSNSNCSWGQGRASDEEAHARRLLLEQRCSLIRRLLKEARCAAQE